MLLQDFEKLNLKVGDKVRIGYTMYWEKTKVKKTYNITEIKETVLAPNKTELCVYNEDGGFLPISSIESIKVLSN